MPAPKRAEAPATDMRSDPSETGGLFVGRRPGSRPVRYRDQPQLAGPRRRKADRLLANALLASIVVACLLFWGPIPILCLWVGSQADYLSGSVSLGILVAFLTVLGTLFGALALLMRVDAAWILVRRAAGVDQRSGALGRVFAITAGVGAIVFCVWFFGIHGSGSSLVSGQSGL